MTPAFDEIRVSEVCHYTRRIVQELEDRGEECDKKYALDTVRIKIELLSPFATA